jgi:hypothetical protein
LLGEVVVSISAPSSKFGESKWTLALRQLTEALELLDESHAPPEIGAELDLAIHRLQEAIGRAGASPPATSSSND